MSKYFSGKKAESLSSRMGRLPKVSKVKSKFSGCSKDFCPCAGLISSNMHSFIKKLLVKQIKKLKSTKTL